MTITKRYKVSFKYSSKTAVFFIFSTLGEVKRFLQRIYAGTSSANAILIQIYKEEITLNTSNHYITITSTEITSL